MNSYTTLGTNRNVFQKFANFRMNKDSHSTNKSNKSGDSILNDSGNLK